MTELSIKDYRMFLLQHNYSIYASYLYNLEKHIERSQNNYIISTSDRNVYIRKINVLLKELCILYNREIINISQEYQESQESQESLDIINISDVFPNISNLNNPSNNLNTIYLDIKNILDLCKTIEINFSDIFDPKYDKHFKDPYDNLQHNLLKLCKNIGFLSIINGLNIIMTPQYKSIYNSYTINMIEMYNNIFIPIKYTEVILHDDLDQDQDIIIKKSEINTGIFINSSADIYLKRYNNKYIVFTGYFTTDSINIILKTSQITNNFIYKKKKLIDNLCLSNNLTNSFYKEYIKNISISELLILTVNDFIENMKKNYEQYNRLAKLSFMNIMKEFILDVNDDHEKKEQDKHEYNQQEHDNILHMYNIIKLLLLGSEENINIAGLLFSITKEKKPSSGLSVSDVIYTNLPYQLQIRLKRTSNNIKTELEKIKSLTINDIDLKKQLAICKNMPLTVKKAALEKIEEMKTPTNEYYKQQMYVKHLLNFPWTSPSDDTFFSDLSKSDEKSRLFLNNITDNLNSMVYGHPDCKTAIKELIGKWIVNPSSSGTAIGLLGPPGVGKTLIAKAIGKSLNIPFVQITLGGQNDGELLHGHGYTYSGAQPGMVVKKMIEAGSSRCIMYFDELDKSCKKNDNNEIYNILIHMIDPNTNSEFQDRFFQEISFPLNRVLFIFSYNSTNMIDPILMDRIKEIEVKSFKLQDKIDITKKFLIPEVTNMIGLNISDIIIEDSIIEFIIDEYTHEAGVRELKRKFEQIFLKLNIDRIYGVNICNENGQIILDKKTIINYLGSQLIKIQYIHTEDQIGVVNGLYATDTGKGGILPIQVYNNYTGSDNRFSLKLTGSQRKIMQESVSTAFTAAINIINHKIRNSFFSKNPHGFHIHTPSGAIPKDGPSAGCAFATAFVSRILNKKIKHNIAMTGEIELTGEVKKIGGLQYKLTGAKRAGVKIVLVSKENEDDIILLKKEYSDLFTNIQVILVDNLKQVLSIVLVDFNNSDIN
jgi:endopeptidase La